MKKLLFIALCALPLNIQSMEEVKNKEQECEEHKSFLANCKGPQELSFFLHYNAINGDQIRLLPREPRQATESNVAKLDYKYSRTSGHIFRHDKNACKKHV